MLPNIMLVQIFFFGALIPWADMYEIKSGQDAMMFLNRFGYLDKNEMEHMEMTPGMEQGKEQMPVLKMYQKMCGLNMTGMLDTETMNMMNVPRCGNVDMENGEPEPDHRLQPNKTRQYDHRHPHHHHHHHNHNSLDNEIGNHRRGKRYVLYSAKTKWNKHLVTYKISMFSNRMGLRVTEGQVLEDIHEAFSIFQKHILLDFEHRPQDSKVDIDIAFTSQHHMQDRYPFDGPGSTLAHAFPPGNHRTSGMVHFDDVEDWSVKSPRGTNVLYVAVHEIGHALGLSHSQTKGAIMFPTYGGYRPVMQLHNDDIQGLQALYGSRLPFTIPPTYPVTTLLTTTTTTTKAPTTVRYEVTTSSWKPTPKYDPRDLCSDPKIDAITTLGDGNVYVFKGEYVFHLDSTGKGVKKGWPQHINTVFKGIPSHLDAVLTRSNKKSYFFKGDQYWRTTMKVVDSGYPKSISSNFVGIPNNVDAAFVRLGKMYFIKGDKYWRFDSMSKPFVSSIYPLPIDNWGIKTNKIDAAFVAPHDFIYLFGDRQYWRLQENKLQVSNVNPPYPRQSSLMWFACHPSYRADLRNIRRSSDEEDDTENEENEYWDVSGESHHHHHEDHDSHQGTHPHHRVHRVRNAFMNFQLGPPF